METSASIRKGVKSSKFRIGKRTFFFDVNTASNSKNYLKITESRFIEDGKDRIRNSVVLFPEDIQDFQKNLKDMVSYLN
jgi:hypothetical protein